IVQAYANQYGITKLKSLITAGNSGVESLKIAIEYISDKYNDEDIVFVQESTRPLVNLETISTLLQACNEKSSATICHAMKEYVQFSTQDSKVSYIDRDAIISIQSPEAHRLSLLKEVFAKAAQRNLSESCCTMLLYNLGYDINFVEGNINNIKIAHDEDIATFSAMVNPQSNFNRSFFTW
ncbi:MAG: 2-C-methyl-D-erythritol 4-phosphate cytidylyltransferase, partial [Oscillospiraceae bacterium]|nr:2-C-methyl-D-erythritol 4-phosphate cytidylyltransferase [Oscillospiraceae bacterium]